MKCHKAWLKLAQWEIMELILHDNLDKKMVQGLDTICYESNLSVI